MVFNILSRILVFSALVFFHELGHYLAARWRGVYVEAFSVGFGRAIASWTDRQGTVWKIGMIPLGGYVKLHGMALDVRDETATDEAAIREGQAFFQKSVASRAVVVAAGPIANFVLAILLFAAVFAVWGEPVPMAVVGKIQPGSAAAAAGLHTGDRILAVDDQKVADFQQLRDLVASSPDRTLRFTLRRDTQELTIPVHLAVVSEDGAATGRLGIESGASQTVRLNPGQALIAGAVETWSVLRMTVVGLSHIIATGQGADELGGPIRMIQLAGQAAAAGVSTLLTLTAYLSVSLGLVNLLPVPVLDGGHLMFYAAEAVRGRPLPRRAQEYGMRFGLALIATLFLFTSWNDLIHTGAFHWVRHLIG